MFCWKTLLNWFLRSLALDGVVCNMISIYQPNFLLHSLLYMHTSYFPWLPLSLTNFWSHFHQITKSPTWNYFTPGPRQTICVKNLKICVNFQSKESCLELCKVLKRGVFRNFENEAAFQRQPKNSELSGHSCCLFHPQRCVFAHHITIQHIGENLNTRGPHL